MQNPFCDFSVAKMLKELGFDEECYGFHALNTNTGERMILDNIKSKWEGSVISAPMWWQVKNWLWEKHNVCVRFHISDELKPDHFYYFIHAANKSKTIPFYDFPNDRRSKPIYESPILADIEGIKKAVEYLYELHHQTKVL